MKRKGDTPCINVVREYFDKMPKQFDGFALLSHVRIYFWKQQVNYFDSYILREMRKLRDKPGRNFICLNKAESKYLKID